MPASTSPITCGCPSRAAAAPMPLAARITVATASMSCPNVSSAPGVRPGVVASATGDTPVQPAAAQPQLGLDRAGAAQLHELARLLQPEALVAVAKAWRAGVQPVDPGDRRGRSPLAAGLEHHQADRGDEAEQEEVGEPDPAAGSCAGAVVPAHAGMIGGALGGQNSRRNCWSHS